MANTVVSLVSIALLCVTIAQGRPNFEATPSSVNDHGFQIDGICQTAVVTQGYKCEEHQVHTYYYIFSHHVESTCLCLSSHFTDELLGGIRFRQTMATSSVCRGCQRGAPVRKPTSHRCFYNMVSSV